MEKLTYKLDAFEGPLDLLLYLIRKNKLHICDIPIAELLDQYMAQIHAAREQDMDVASEFLEMASRLVYMKTLSLLPRPEEADQLKAELSGQLLEYEACKRVALLLGRQLRVDSFIREPEEVEPDTTFRRHIAPQRLLRAYYDAAGKRAVPRPTQASFAGIVSHRVVSVASQIVNVLRRLWRPGRVRLHSLFAGRGDRSEVVASFLAVLELVRGGRLRVEGDGPDPTVKLVKDGERKRKRES